MWMALKQNDVSDIQQGLLNLNVLSQVQAVLSQNPVKELERFAFGMAVMRRLISRIIYFINSTYSNIFRSDKQVYF